MRKKIHFSSQGNSPSPDKFSDNNGYYIFPNGLIIQWGKYYVHSDNALSGEINAPLNLRTIYFPITFPHKCFSVSITPELTPSKWGNSLDKWLELTSVTQTSAVFVQDDLSDSGYFNIPYYVDWIAIGY